MPGFKAGFAKQDQQSARSVLFNHRRRECWFVGALESNTVPKSSAPSLQLGG